MKKFLLLAGLGALWATEARLDGTGTPVFFVLDDEVLALRFCPVSAADFTGNAILEMGTQWQLRSGESYAGLLFGNPSLAHGLYFNAIQYRYTDFSADSQAVRALTYVIAKGGEGGGFGLRTSFGYFKTEDEDLNYDQNAYLFSLEPGFRFGSLEGFLTVGLASFSETMDTFYTYSAESPLHRFGASLRYVRPGDFNWLFGLRLGREDWSTKYETSDTTITRDTTALSFGVWAGLNARPVENAQVWTGVLIDYSRSDWQDSLYATTTDLRLHLGGELWATEWLALRAGTRASLMLSEYDRLALGSSPISLFLGSGIKLGSLRVDATLSEDLLYNGPYFLTGNPSALVGRLAAVYAFSTQE